MIINKLLFQVSDQVMKTVALLMTRPATKSRNKIAFHGEKHSVIVAEPRTPERPSFEVTAVIEPATVGAQKIAPVLLVLQQVVNAKIRYGFISSSTKPHQT